MLTGGGACPPARSEAERCPWPNASEFTHAWNASSSRHLVTTSQVVRPSVGLSNSKPSKPSWLSTAPARAANLRASSSPLPAGTVIALILTTVMPPIMPAPVRRPGGRRWINSGAGGSVRLVIMAGEVLGGRYLLDGQIGRGGYSEVWRAADTVLSRPVAVKLLHAAYAAQPHVLTRFQAEARHAGSLTHKNIARIYDYGEPAEGQPPFLVMELVDGPSLEEILARGGALDPRRAMDIIAQAAAGLAAAHAVGLIHRDIKPANLLLDRSGVVKVTDFGIAHAVGSVPMTATGEVLGTPGYISPERVGGAQATPSSDLYALGIVGYECLAGQPPFRGTPLQVALAHRDSPLPALPADVPPGAVELVMRLTAKDPEYRPADAAEVASTAARVRDDLAAAAVPHFSPAPAPPPAVPAGPATPVEPAPRRLMGRLHRRGG